MPRITPAFIAAVSGALALGACAGPFTGPVEVTRFVSPDRGSLGQGTIRVTLADGTPEDLARAAYVQAVSEQLSRVGYTVVPADSTSQQIATIRTSRQSIAAGPQGGRSPVSVGVGGGGGSFGGGGFGGLGGGVGINLGGGQSGPNVNTELFVRINNATGQSLWEGRAQIATAVKSPYSQMNLSARTLASGLFREFPGGNGETVTIKAQDLQPSQ
jgi:hypothetical protein